MEAPFTFGRVVSGRDFTNREQETETLVQNFVAGTHTILISPRRWGKSSLVAKAADLAAAQKGDLRVCHLDLYNVRDEEEFYRSLAEGVLRASSTRLDEITDGIKKFLSRFIPKLNIGAGPDTDFSLGLDWKEVKLSPDDILDMAEKLAADKGIKLLICIDEFQNLSGFDEPLNFQKKLRAHWQKHSHVTYCLYGSKRHMMMDVFTNPSMPFYKFGQTIFLEKIRRRDWVTFITERFVQSGKKISPELADLIAQSADDHPYYVQQVAQLAWFRTTEQCREKDVWNALYGLIMQLSMLFRTQTDNLSNTQVNFLKAMLSNVEQYSAKETLDEFKLGTSANVNRIKQALIQKEIIDMDGHVPMFLDPIYRIWLKNYYFKI